MKLFLGFLIVSILISGCTGPITEPPTNITNPFTNQITLPDSPPLFPSSPPSPPNQPGLQIPTEGGLPGRIVVSENFSFTEKQLLFTGGYADPAVIRLENGTIVMFLFQFAEGKERGTFALTSADGISWKEQTGILFPGLARVKPLKVENGYRMFHGWSPSIDPNSSPNNPNLMGYIVSSFSESGITDWEYEGITLTPDSEKIIVSANAIQLVDGTFRMFFDETTNELVPEGKIFGAFSDDGKTWTRDSNPTIVFEESVEGIGSIKQILSPFIIQWEQGYLLFYNSHSKIFAAYSEDAVSWEKLGYTGIFGADTHGIIMPDNSIRLYFGDFSEETSGVVYTADLIVNLNA